MVAFFATTITAITVLTLFALYNTVPTLLSTHPLTFLPIPTYSTYAFTCIACGSHGSGFSYSCAHCEFDLHMNCALFLPARIRILNKHPHELTLAFDFPEIFACNVCGAAVENYLWRCDCDFGIHLGCTKHNQQLQ
ncbi:hypothetical protein ACH5RR_000652 [Cinchona calisaya]|uniref:DC1 domain-containing protein n=1 Tax=Cinchona calisaya TaxID=153742 RepID=A0ABD3B1G9_9GENT